MDGGDATDASSVGAVNGSDSMSDAFSGSYGDSAAGGFFGGDFGFGESGVPDFAGTLGGNVFGDSPYGDSPESPYGDNPSFTDQMQQVVIHGLKGKGLSALFGQATPIVSAGLKAFGAPEGKKGGSFMGSLLDSANPLSGLMALAGIPTLGQTVANHGGYSGGDAPTGFNGGATNNSGNTGNEMGWGSALGGLGQLYSMYSRNKQSDAYTNSLANMYGQNSPYAQALQKQLAARDAAAGKRSQYGPRSVELQAALAKAAAGVAPSVMQGQQQGFSNTMQMMQQLGALQKMGAFSKLSDLFGGGGQQQNYTPVDYSSSNTSLIPSSNNMFDNMDFSNPFGG